MATVTTPTGEVLEGVTGDLLAYYRGEANTVGGYVIEDDESAVAFPRVFDGEKYVEPEADAPTIAALQTLGNAAGEAADANAALGQSMVDLGKHAEGSTDDPSA